MKQTILLWALALVIAVTVMIYQRRTGPTYPLSGSVTFNGKEISYSLKRSHGGGTDAPVEIKTGDPAIQGTLSWKRYKTNDEWIVVQMSSKEGILQATLPHQPPAGKLIYKIELQAGEQRTAVPAGDPVIIRFKGEEPAWVLFPHVLAMIGAMLLSTRTGLEFFRKEPKLKSLTFWTIGFLFVGGFVLGPLMQWYAFGKWWTGWPLGTDLTDNKTAVAMLGWIFAAIALSKSRHPKRWALGAAIVMIVVYLIPHSVLGSELNYQAMDQQKQPIQKTQ